MSLIRICIHVGMRREFHCTSDLCDYVKFKTDTPDSESRAGVRSRSTESGDYDEYWTDCLNIYICKCTI